MMKAWILRFTLLGCFTLAAAGCSSFAGQLAPVRTQIAGEVFATLTASAPTVTPAPTGTPAPTSTSEPTLTPTYIAQAVVIPGNLNLREGPNTIYPAITQLKTNDSLEVLGQFGECTWLKVSNPEGVEGWVKNDPGLIQLSGDCMLIPPGTFRPPSGTFMYDRRTQVGPGTLTVQNNAPQDAVLVLADPAGAPVVAFYIRSGENYTLNRILDGSYLLYYQLGREWNGEDIEFTIPVSQLRFKDQLAFSTANGSAASWTVSLKSAGDAAADAVEISASEFPPLK